MQSDSQISLKYEGIVPKKALATFTLRMIYTSTALLGTTNVAINYLMMKILI